jgi:hypothetical protein
MGDVQTMRDRPKEKLRGRERRSLNLSTKLTAGEARVIEDAATRAGRTPSVANGVPQHNGRRRDEYYVRGIYAASVAGATAPFTVNIDAASPLLGRARANMHFASNNPG